MRTRFLKRRIDYNGNQLASHWIYRTCNVPGDAAVAFVGACDVPLERMVDLADVKRRAPIFSHEMLHFIVEHFDRDLEKAVLRQRLLVAIVRDEVASRAGRAILRDGDDLYDGRAKLSVSIATASPVSTLIHFGINIDSRGTPVRSRGLRDYRIEPRKLAAAVLRRYTVEVSSIEDAKCKVRGVP
jgi:hypothetical protein